MIEPLRTRKSQLVKGWLRARIGTLYLSLREPLPEAGTMVKALLPYRLSYTAARHWLVELRRERAAMRRIGQNAG